MIPFSHWLAQLLDQSNHETTRLLSDDSGLHFLIAWTLLESKCFSGFLKPEKLPKFAQSLVDQGFDHTKLSSALYHFHDRYQDPNKLANLLHSPLSKKQNDKRKDAEKIFKNLLQLQPSTLSAPDSISFVLFVVYRYRNNMFHGNKGVASWLSFKEQISFCIHLMQEIVLFSDLKQKSERDHEAA